MLCLLKKSFLAGCFLLLFWLSGVSLATFFPPEIETPYSREILDRENKLIHCILSTDQKWRLETKEDQLPDRLINLILWKEDKYFHYHLGINPISAIKSAIQNLISGKRLSGASTITMQAVKLQEKGKRTWRNKIKESFIAIYWEMGLSKKEILSFYFSHLPFGGNLEGFRSASYIYFEKNLDQLTLAQFASLAIIPNQPSRLNPLKNPELLKKKRNQFLEKLWKAEKITQSEYDEAVLEPIFARKHAMPNAVPHLARKLFQSPGNKIFSSIDSRLQNEAGQMLNQGTAQLKRIGINNAALLLADIETGEILSWIGNTDFADAENNGQVDGVEAIRSPGSTLKPFIYEMAFRKGLITPKTVLYDIPTEFSSYIPENYDQKFRGSVFADQALVQSLNIPAIILLQQLGVDSLLALLEKNGMTKLRKNSQNPGLSLAVGGCGTNLFELVQAYRNLADQGKFKPLLLSKTGKKDNGTSIMDVNCTEMIRKILSVKNRNEALFSISYRKENYESVAWKTGTSFGRKDAWCIGFGKKYVLGLWLGNFTGVGHPGLSGLETAAPLFQKLISHFEKNEKRRSSDGLSFWKKRWVCENSGLRTGLFCSDSIQDYSLPLISSQAKCEHIKEIWVSSNLEITYCVHCKPRQSCKKIRIQNYSPAFLSFLVSEGKEIKTPPHNPNCQFTEQEKSLKFQNPINGKIFFLEGKASVPIGITINAEADAFPIEFFSGSKKIGLSKNGEVLMSNFGEGIHSLFALDSKGRSCNVKFSIRDF